MYRTKQKVDYYSRFVNSIKSPYTRTMYDNSLKHYIKDMDVKSYDELIECLDGDPGKIKELEDNLIEYIQYLQNEKQLSYGTVHTKLAGIFHFYTMNRINLNKVYVYKFLSGKKRVSKDTAYTRKQIQQILSVSDTRQKVIILLMASTGMRVGAIHSLKLSHLQSINVGSQHLYKITVYDMEPEEYYTFTTFECAEAIDIYLEYRKRFNEKLTPEAPLIRNEFDKYFLEQARKPKPISRHTILRLVDERIIQSGMKERIAKTGHKSLRHSVQRAHGFRKFIITQMIKAKMDYESREYLVGHRHSRGLDENYDRTSVEDRLSEYLKAVNLLTISEEHRLKEKVRQLTIDNETLSQLEMDIKSLKELVIK